jgi:hypothetical protein
MPRGNGRQHQDRRSDRPRGRCQFGHRRCKESGDHGVPGSYKCRTHKGRVPRKADPAQINRPLVIGILFLLVLYVTMVYGPIAALLVELFPTRIRYTSMSLPYHIGNGWLGGFLPTTAFAMVAATGNIYYGLWYPVTVAVITLIVGLLFLPETFKRKLSD